MAQILFLYQNLHISVKLFESRPGPLVCISVRLFGSRSGPLACISVRLFGSRSGPLVHISLKLFGSRSGPLVYISVKLFTPSVSVSTVWIQIRTIGPYQCQTVCILIRHICLSVSVSDYLDPDQNCHYISV